MATGIRIVEFIENYYGRSLEELSKQIQATRLRGEARDDALQQLLDLEDFLALYEQQLIQPFVVDALNLEEPTPVFAKMGARHNKPLQDAVADSQLRQSRGSSDSAQPILDPYQFIGDCFGAPSLYDSKELKSILLYSEDTLVIDPITRRRVLSDDEFQMFEQQFGAFTLNPMGITAMRFYNKAVATGFWSTRADEIAETLLLLGDIAPLLRSGKVMVVPLPPRDSFYWGDEDAIRMQIGAEVFALSDGNPQRLRDCDLMAYLLLERAKDQVLAMERFGPDCSAFAAGRLDVFALNALLGSMSPIEEGEVDGGPSERWLGGNKRGHDLFRRTSEDRRLTELARLELPGVDNLKPRDMVKVRQFEVFEEFRSTVRQTLGLTDAEPDLGTAQQIFAEEMARANERMGATRYLDVLRETKTSDVVSWSVGAIVGWSLAGWRGTAASTAATAALELSRARRDGRPALRRHYVALS